MKNWARAEAKTFDTQDGTSRDWKSLLDFALLEVEDDSMSINSPHQSNSLENYLQGTVAAHQGLLEFINAFYCSVSDQVTNLLSFVIFRKETPSIKNHIEKYIHLKQPFIRPG